MNFASVPKAFRETMKAIVYRYMRRGREGQRRPSDRATVKLLRDANPFLKHLERLGVERLADVTPQVCGSYVETCRRHRQSTPRSGKSLKASSLGHRLGVVEALYEISQCTDDAMVSHPWPETSYTYLAGLTGPGTRDRGGTTPLIPDVMFTTLFQEAWSRIKASDTLLKVRDEWLLFNKQRGQSWSGTTTSHELGRFVQKRGWRGARAFNEALHELRTACYIVIASLSGCRNHEIAFIQSGACYSTTSPTGDSDARAEVYWWMCSQSTKTGEGYTEWMIPEAAAVALRAMEHWARPYQEVVEGEVESRRARDPLDPEIAEALRHRHALFLAAEPRRANQVRTASLQMINIALKAFAKKCGLEWELATHQFRRKFANYAARSQFGDLRYLKQHFKHWSLDMTLGYALNESQEMALYAEIHDELEEIKAGVVESWLKSDAPLAGGYGANIVAWRGTNPVTLFRDHKQMVRSLAESTAIRSNGHAWCTADDNLCVGNDIERTRCSDCSNAVIGLKHAQLYRGLHDHLNEVRQCDDIGEGGLKLVQRDMNRCRNVLLALGQDAPEVEP
jgi:integrase